MSLVKKVAGKITGPGKNARLNKLYYVTNKNNSPGQLFANKTIKMNMGAFMQNSNRHPNYNFSATTANGKKLLGLAISKPREGNNTILNVSLVAVESLNNNKTKEKIPGLQLKFIKKVLQHARQKKFKTVDFHFIYPNMHKKTNVTINNKLGKELGFNNMKIEYKKALNIHRYNMAANMARRSPLRAKAAARTIGRMSGMRDPASIIEKMLLRK